MPTDFYLFFAEDPGAANYITGILGSSEPPLFRYEVFASGIAEGYFRQAGIGCKNLEAGGVAKVLADSRPTIAIVGTAENPRSVAHDIVAACRKLGIPSAAVVDAAMNSSSRFSGTTADPLAHLPDYLLVADDHIRGEYIDLGVLPERIFPCGHPHYDEILHYPRLSPALLEAKRQEYFPGKKPSQKSILFISEGSQRWEINRRKREEYSIGRDSPAVGRTEVVLSELMSSLSASEERPYLCFRLHPKDQAVEYGGLLGLVDHISQAEPPLEMLLCADIVIGITSMMLTEAAILGLPTLSIVPLAEERKWLPSVRSNATKMVCTRQELDRAIGQILACPDSFRPVKEFFPRGSIRRAREALAKIAGSRNHAPQ